MGKRRKLFLIILTISVFVLASFFILFFKFYKDEMSWYSGRGIESIKNSTITSTNMPVKTETHVSYYGVEGKNALLLLGKYEKFEQASSGLVISINGRKANEKDREFWAFYINGKTATVGPEAYITKKGDVIEWKIEKY